MCNEAFRNDADSIDVYIFKDLEFIPFFYDYLSKLSYFFEIDYLNIMRDETNVIENQEDAFVYNLLKE